MAGACLWMVLPGAVRALETPQEVVDKTAQRVIEILANRHLSSDQKREQIEEVVYARVDFPTLCRLVLARNWNRLSAPQQQEFMEEFRKHLSMTYGRNVDSYKNEKVQIVGGREESKGDYTVMTKIVRGGTEDIMVDYRLRENDNTWRIIDIIIERVSLVSNFRSQFQEIISNGGPEKLIELLREKNAKGEPLKS